MTIKGSSLEKEENMNDESSTNAKDVEQCIVPVVVVQRIEQNCSNQQAGGAPVYQKVDRLDDDDDEKACRICLETDHADNMIAPCKCKGSSKWVHRECLDLWRTNEQDRAFSKCTECLFPYNMQPIHDNESSAKWRRQATFMMKVTRDVCLLTVAVQLTIAALGFLVWCFDREQSLPASVNPDYPIVVYYLFGFLTLLLLLGIAGSLSLCQNGCSVSESLEPHRRPLPDAQQPSYAARSETYQQRRHRSHQQDCCNSCYHPYGYYHPVYYGDPGPCCFCCCPTNNVNRGVVASHHTHCDGSCCLQAGDCDGGESCLVCLVLCAVFMAILGFVMGIVLTVFFVQRVVQRHLYLLHKRQLVHEFQVMDLAGYDLEQPLRESTTQQRSTLNENDNAYLQKLGLMEQKS